MDRCLRCAAQLLRHTRLQSSPAMASPQLQLNVLYSKQPYKPPKIKKKSKFGKSKNAANSDADLEATAYSMLDANNVIAVHDHLNRHLISLPFKDMEHYVAKEFPNKEIVHTDETNESGEQIVKVRQKKMKESTFTLSPKIGQADLQVKVTGIKNKARQVDRVNVQVKPKGCGEDQLKIFQSHIKTLLENEGLAVSEMKNEQWGLFVKALKEKS